MKVFMDTVEEWPTYEITEVELASSYMRKHGRLFRVPRRLVRRHAQLMKDLERLNEDLGLIFDEGGEESPFAEQLLRPQPRFSTYQLRHVQSGILLVEVTTPEGAAFHHDFPAGAEPEGVLQWWAKHMGDDRFSKHGEEFSYTTVQGHRCRHRYEGLPCRRADGHRGEHVAWSDASGDASVINWSDRVDC
jgi:hypothetical protein